MTNTFFIATITVAGTNIASRALKIFSTTATDSKPFLPSPLAKIKTAPDKRNGIVSLPTTLTNPTKSPIAINAIIHAEPGNLKTPKTIARITPKKNAQPLITFKSFTLAISPPFSLLNNIY